MSSLRDDATALQVAAMKDEDVVRLAEERGYIVHKPQPPLEPVEVDISHIRGDRVKLGIISDTHIGSKYQQVTYLRQHARYMAQQGCTAILVPGDVTDGSPSMHPGFVYETWAHGADAQVDAAVEAFPDLGIPWYLIGGNHDASHMKAGGIDVIAAICARRPDFNYLGPRLSGRNFAGSIGYLTIGEVLIQMAHPHLPGTRVSSYRLETWIENLSVPRPRLTILGNFHKPVEVPDYRSTWGIQVGAYQAQSGWMASKSIRSVISGCILEFGATVKGLASERNVTWLIEPEPIQNDWPGGS